MRQAIPGFVLFITMPLLADVPKDIQINTTGTFDANLVFTGTFIASGGINEVGSAVDTPRFNGVAIHISWLLTTSHGDYITVKINSNHVAGTNVTPPDWCAPPPAPPGTVLFLETGNWSVVSGTGPFTLLDGTGSRVAWVILDSATITPLAATECLKGAVKDVQ